MCYPFACTTASEPKSLISDHRPKTFLYHCGHLMNLQPRRLSSRLQLRHKIRMAPWRHLQQPVLHLNRLRLQVLFLKMLKHYFAVSYSYFCLIRHSYGATITVCTVVQNCNSSLAVGYKRQSFSRQLHLKSGLRSQNVCLGLNFPCVAVLWVADP